MYPMFPIDYSKLTAADRRLPAAITTVLMLVVALVVFFMGEHFGAAIFAVMFVLSGIVTLVEHRDAQREKRNS